jgi:hypothetical protein
VETPSSPSFHLSQSPWTPKDSTKERHQDWMENTLPRTLHLFSFKFLEFPSSSSLKRYSNLRFAWYLYSVQRFEFPLVEHHLRTPRRHTYSSIDFCWTHCENSRFGGGRLAPIWPVLPTGLTGGGCPTLNHVFFMFSTNIYAGMLLDHQYSYLFIQLLRLTFEAIGSVLDGTGLTGAPHWYDRWRTELTQLFQHVDFNFYSIQLSLLCLTQSRYIIYDSRQRPCHGWSSPGARK